MEKERIPHSPQQVSNLGCLRDNHYTMLTTD